jgi:hypothetical protein
MAAISILCERAFSSEPCRKCIRSYPVDVDKLDIAQYVGGFHCVTFGKMRRYIALEDGAKMDLAPEN